MNIKKKPHKVFRYLFLFHCLNLERIVTTWQYLLFPFLERCWENYVSVLAEFWENLFLLNQSLNSNICFNALLNSINKARPKGEIPSLEIKPTEMQEILSEYFPTIFKANCCMYLQLLFCVSRLNTLAGWLLSLKVYCKINNVWNDSLLMLWYIFLLKLVGFFF